MALLYERLSNTVTAMESRIIVLSCIVLFGLSLEEAGCTTIAPRDRTTREGDQIEEYGTKEFRADYTFFPNAGGWLKVHPKNVWNVARHQCQLEGAELVYPNSKEIIDAMISLMKKDKSIKAVLTGMKLTVDNANLTIENDRVILNRDGTLGMVHRNDEIHFICHKKQFDCGINNQGFFLDTRTRHCYKLDGPVVRFYDAVEFCERAGSSLAVINSDVEALAIRDMFARVPLAKYGSADWSKEAFIGIIKDETYRWRSLDGVPLEETGYKTFAEGEPNDANGGENCMSVDRNGKLNDVKCELSELHLYICKIKEPRLQFSVKVNDLIF